MEKGKYGVLVLGGRRTHQESYARCFAEDERCQLDALLKPSSQDFEAE